MKTFKFYCDEKITCWQRSFFEITAENPDQATKTAMANMNDIEESETVNITNHETILETIKTVRVEDNRNCPTVELYRDSGEHIMDNLSHYNCNEGHTLTYGEDIKQKMEEAFNEYYSIYLEEPLFALCRVAFIGTDESAQDMLFKLSTDIGDDDDEIFFYCNGIEELKSLAGYSGNDFIITGMIEFFNP